MPEANTRTDTMSTLDPVDYAVISQGLIAAAREMGAKLIRSAYSTIVREASDASAALLDRDGNVVAQAELIPMQLGPMADTFRACAALYPVDELVEGDFYINNDPFAGGQHLQDVFIYSPIFVDGKVIGFAGTVAHHLDLGGGNPGLTTAAADVHAEGFIFPPSKYNLKRDWYGGPLERLVAANIRVPAQTIGDFNAQFAANAIGGQRVTQICEKYGVDSVTAVMTELMDYSERRFRAALIEIPDGTYYGEDALDDDGLTDKPLEVKATLVVKGDTISVDFAGSCPQVTRNLNCPFSSTVSSTLSAIKSVLTSPDIPFNEGVKRPISITAPKGSLLNPNYPAPVRARMEAGYRCFNAVMKALAQIVPDRVIAGGNDTTTVTSISHLDEGKYRVYLEVFGGGYGASLNTDGCDAVDAPLSNCANTPIEATDMDFSHFRIVGYGLLPDSCGHGRHRGGLGFYRRYEILKDDVNFAIYADRFRLSPYGLFGGTDGEVARCEVERGGEIISVKSKDMLDLRKGDILTLYTAGGAGYGPVGERPSEAVRRDVEHGYITPETAKSVYGLEAAE
ncbi:N-methylhydantoinase B [Limibacillus sp. MBR-115]